LVARFTGETNGAGRRSDSMTVLPPGGDNGRPGVPGRSTTALSSATREGENFGPSLCEDPSSANLPAADAVHMTSVSCGCHGLPMLFTSSDSQSPHRQSMQLPVVSFSGDSMNALHACAAFGNCYPHRSHQQRVLPELLCRDLAANPAAPPLMGVTLMRVTRKCNRPEARP
jgi:hypothetical protein